MKKNKELKAFFVNENCHQTLKELSVKNKVTLSVLVENLLNLGLKEYRKDKNL